MSARADDSSQVADKIGGEPGVGLRRFKPYPAYKDSGVEWMGGIPSHWGTKPLKRVTTSCGGGTPDKGNLDYWRGDMLWVSPKDMRSSIVSDTEDKITGKAIRESAARPVPTRSVLIVVRSGILAHTIPVALNTREVTLNQDLKALIPNHELVPEYLLYLISGLQQQLLVEWRQEGATVESLESDRIANTPTLLPTTSEQHAIAAFLHRETARIDALVAKKERLIALLREKRTALIAQAVTKGLDPDVLRKDSGVEWLGKIPMHWSVAPLKSLLRRCDYGISESLAGVGDTRVLTMAHIQEGRVLLPQEGVIDGVDDALLLDFGDLLFNRTNSRELVGKVGAFWGSRKDGVTFASYLVRMSARAGVFAGWLNYLLNSTAILGFVRSLALLSINQANLNPTKYTRIAVPVPAEEEQRSIAAYLDEETATVDALITVVDVAIERLKELRTATISAAVTGKIDVRNEAA